MTVHWITAITIIEGSLQNPEERIIFFSVLEQIVTPLSFFTQLLLTNIIIKSLGLRTILFSYGIIFIFVFISYATMPSIMVVAIATVILRLFEYAINKPTREIVYSFLDKNDRYKSSVFIDTFLTRLGDFSGSGFIAFGKLASITFNIMPILAIPFAGILSYAGMQIAKKANIKDL